MLDDLADNLARTIAGVSCGPSVDRASPVGRVLSDVWCDSLPSHGGSESRGVEALVRSDCRLRAAGRVRHQPCCRLPLPMVSVRQGHFRPHHQTVPILDHDVAQVRQLCTLVVPLGEHPRIRIRGSLVRFVPPALAPRIHVPGAPAAAATAVVVRSVLLLETLVARPPFHPRALPPELLVPSQPRIPSPPPPLLPATAAPVFRQ